MLSKCFESSLCIGKFDGFHIGHQIITEYTKKFAKENQLESVLFTFKFPGDTLTIDSEEEKRYFMNHMGFDRIVEQPFTEEFRSMEPEQFISQVLVEKYHVRCIVAGDDFTFGRDGKGNCDTLKEYSSKYGYQVKVFHKEKLNGQVVSSSRIREVVEQGKMSDVSCMLGRNYTVIGPVVYGNQLGGSVLNMPTANQVPGSGKILPPCGVYASRVRVGHKWYDGVSNIGKKPTIPGPNNIGIETYLYGFQENIYGEIIRVELLWFLRPEQKFQDMEALKSQMAQDKLKAKEVLDSLKA